MYKRYIQQNVYEKETSPKRLSYTTNTYVIIHIYTHILILSYIHVNKKPEHIVLLYIH